MTVLLSILAALGVLVLPGLACVAWLDPAGRTVWEQLAEAVGLSFSLTALLGLVFYLLRLPPGGWGLAVYLGLALAALLAAAVRGRLARVLGAGGGRRAAWLGGAGAVALGALLVLRFAQVSELALPAWVDSVHHTLIVRKMLAYGGLPPDLTPYLTVPFHYHYGFHLQAAAFAALSGLDPAQAVLWLGQGISALVSLSIYRLARSCGQSQRSALLAALISGFVLFLPAYYTTWGRYTLLSGLVVLPLAMAAVQEALDRPTRPGLLRLGLLTAGLCLTHYLALLLFALYLLVIALERLALALKNRSLRGLPWGAAVACLAGLAAALPWLVPMLRANSASLGLGEPRLALNPGSFDGLLAMLRPAYDQNLMALAAFCCLLAFFRPGLRRFASWGVVLLFFSMPFAPQPGPFRSDLFSIVLFMPASLLLGWGLASGAEALARVLTRRANLQEGTRQRAAYAAFGGMALLLLGLGVSQTRHVLNEGTILADAADREALDWVSAHTPADARFFVNSTPWMSQIYRGVDGGYWLLPYAARFSLVPPAIYTWGAPDQVKQANAWIERAAKLTGCGPDFWALVREARLGYVYLREGRGNLQPKALDHCPRLKPLYRQGGVVIYQVLTP